MRTFRPGAERRRKGRPEHGDRHPCDACGSSMEFDEYLVVAVVGTYRWQPAWVCANAQCGGREFVRADDRASLAALS